MRGRSTFLAGSSRIVEASNRVQGTEGVQRLSRAHYFAMVRKHIDAKKPAKA